MLFINDPSHICGRRDILQEVAQTAIDLDFDGLIIESHIDPDKAWSDAKQQITPARLGEMLGNIRWRKEDIASDEYHAALEKLRQQINQLDDELMQIIGERMKVQKKSDNIKKTIILRSFKQIDGMPFWKGPSGKEINLVSVMSL